MSAATDFIVIGAGIAGASVASELARDHNVVLLEAEDAPGYHSTGRSAAMWVPEYGPPVIRALTKASGSFFHTPPDGFVEAPILTPKGEMMLALNGQEDEIEKELSRSAQGSFRQVSVDEIADHIPLIKINEIVGGLLDDGAYEIDVDVLFQGFLRAYKARGGTLVCNARVENLARVDNLWRAQTPSGDFTAPVVINASGAWGDKVAELAGINKVGLVPKRRSAALVPPPEGADVSNWPLGFGAGESFYFKPTSGQLMVSPADETPVEPHDAWA
ncbi:MAG: NAD(P)/FAD-dependent oxidoreductase, partial [Hyphomicrobiales bacterium]